MVTRIIADVGALGTFLGVVFAGVQLIYNRRQARTQFEDGMTGVYRSLAAELHVEVFFDAPISREIVQAHRAVFYRYFDLCNEQAFLAERRRSAFRTAWCEDINPSVGEDFHEFKRVLKALFEDPCKSGRLQGGRGVAEQPCGSPRLVSSDLA